jgi:hypothetical protein
MDNDWGKDLKRMVRMLLSQKPVKPGVPMGFIPAIRGCHR